jgi:hypothetical protein
VQGVVIRQGGAGCYRDPYLPEVNKPTNALAYQPKAKNAAHHAKKPLDVQ